MMVVIGILISSKDKIYVVYVFEEKFVFFFFLVFFKNYIYFCMIVLI